MSKDDTSVQEDTNYTISPECQDVVNELIKSNNFDYKKYGCYEEWKKRRKSLSLLVYLLFAFVAFIAYLKSDLSSGLVLFLSLNGLYYFLSRYSFSQELVSYNSYNVIVGEIITKQKDVFAFRTYWHITYRYVFNKSEYGPETQSGFEGNGVTFIDKKHVLIMVNPQAPSNSYLYNEKYNNQFNFRKENKINA